MDQNLQVVPTFVHKIVQLYETMVPLSLYSRLNEFHVEGWWGNTPDVASTIWLIGSETATHPPQAVRHGVMLVGTTGTGKTVCYRALQTALTSLAIQGADPANELYCKVHTHQLNPKSVTMADLYGEVCIHVGDHHAVVRACESVMVRE